MDLSNLIQRINQIAPLFKASEERILSNLKEEKFSKRDLILKEGQIAKRIYFIQQGFCRSFYVQGDKEFTTWFMGEGDIMISVYSFFTQQPSAENIEVLEDSVLLSMTWQ
ncbi:MAG: Crp/Fnr family transcriptional regulator [Janthinobacterium lividum]